MIKAHLRDYIERVLAAKRISGEDVIDLQRNVLPDGVMCRNEADALLALDRTLDADATWSDALTALLVDYVVWGSRPTGKVTQEDAHWLVASLDVGTPTPTALKIAYAVAEEAEQVDEALLAFILRGRRQGARVLAA
jgi:hypothetical protein